jgi:TonB-linked SusC/RagA family outer membrane protein
MMYRNALLTALLILASVAPVSAQQRRTITGRVVEEGSSRPIGGAQITIKGTNTGVLGRQDGTFTLSAPQGPVTLVIQFIGFKRTEVPVAANTSAVNVSLGTDVLNMDEIVVTGQATGIQRRNLANAVAKVNAAELVKAPAATVSNALMGKVAGAQIYSNSGAPGGGVRVRLRGITSINGGSQPLYVIDGVILSDVAIPPGTNIVTGAGARTNIAIATQETPVNRISDLNPNDIESVEVLKGAAASAIYGSKASNGVIVITTKRGKPGDATYTIRQGFGTAKVSYLQGSRRFTTLADAIDAFGPNAAAQWAPDKFFDHEKEIMDNTPLNYETAAGVSGGSEKTRFYASVTNKHEGGVVTNTYSDKQDIRLNLDQQVGSRLTLRMNTQVIHSGSDRGLFNNDNTGTSYYYILSKMPSFFDARLREDGTFPEPNLPGFRSNHLQSVELFKNKETVWRSVASGTADLTVVDSDVHTLKLLATGGADVFNQKNVILSPPALFFEDDDGLIGTSGTSFGQNINLNVNANAVHSFKPAGDFLSATTSAGLQVESRSLDVTRVAGQGLLGATNFDISTVQTTDQDKQDVRDLGFFLQEEVILGERLLLTAGIRADKSSNNADVSQYFWYPKAATSYRFPGLVRGVIDELKIRAAYGQSGNQPLFAQKFTQLNTNIISGSGGFVLPTQAGASQIVPERQAEFEGGIDAALFDGRGNLELTAYEKNITDLLLNRTLAPSSGFNNEYFNGGKLRVRGLEVVGTVAPFKGDFQWTSRVNYAMNRTMLMELPVPAFLISSPTTGALRIEVGHPVTELWGNDTITAGPASAGIPECAAVAAGSQCVYAHKIGDSTPEFTMGLSNEFTFKGFRFYTLFDGQRGGMQAAGTWRHYDLGKNTVDYDEIGPNGVKKGLDRVNNYRNVTAVYFQDISFIKLREATIGYEIPVGLVQSLRLPARSARLTLSGRELKTWTDYRGGDPEYNTFYAGTSALQVNRELMAYPPSRSFWLNLDFTF